jgi:hypothetical protein
VNPWTFYRMTGVTTPHLLAKKLRHAQCYAAVRTHGWDGQVCLYIATQDLPYDVLRDHVTRTYVITECSTQDVPRALARLVEPVLEETQDAVQPRRPVRDLSV